MKMRDYQYASRQTAVYPGQGTMQGLLYVALGLGEVGELQGKIKKVLRDDGGVLTVPKALEILDEAGDALWYLTRVIEEVGGDLDEVARRNLAKLADRADRGVLGGSGDNR